MPVGLDPGRLDPGRLDPGREHLDEPRRRERSRAGVTDGTGGVATIGISGYNGASSSDALRPADQGDAAAAGPGQLPGRAISVSPANRGTLPGSLPTTTKSLFIVNKQRLLAMYDAASVNNLLSALNTLAARPEVAAPVLRSTATRPCSPRTPPGMQAPCNSARANTVVRSINDVVAGYRNSVNGLPNLHYIVLTGSDELTRWRARRTR